MNAIHVTGESMAICPAMDPPTAHKSLLTVCLLYTRRQQGGIWYMPAAM